MSHSRNIDNEVNAPYQMRDVIIWGCAAIIAATAAISSYVIQSDFEFTKFAATNRYENNVDADGQNFAETMDAPSANDSISNSQAETDNFVTGSIKPKNTEKLRSGSADSNSAGSFGTTIARRQSNADAIRRMRDDENSQLPVEQPVLSSEGTNLGSGAIGIDLGTGYSFSVLGRRFTALVNAAPTLFTNLSARASIVEHESSIEAHLVAGPLKDVETAKLLCKKIKLRVNTTCQPTNFTGRKLKLF